MADTNLNFFDSNKLYVKSLADYKTKNGMKPVGMVQPPKILPALDRTKKAMTRKNSKTEQPYLSVDM